MYLRRLFKQCKLPVPSSCNEYGCDTEIIMTKSNLKNNEKDYEL